MQTVLALHLSSQSEVINAIHGDALVSENHVRQGVDVLKNVKDNSGGGRTWMFWCMIMMSLVLLVLDYLF